MKREEFIEEYCKTIADEDKEVFNCVKENLVMALDISEYNEFENIDNLKALPKEEFLKVSSFVCGVINLKTSMTEIEEKVYKFVKEIGKSIDESFTSLIKESTARFQGAMFYEY